MIEITEYSEQDADKIMSIDAFFVRNNDKIITDLDEMGFALRSELCKKKINCIASDLRGFYAKYNNGIETRLSCLREEN